MAENQQAKQSPLGVVHGQKNAAIQTLVIQSDRMPGNMVPDMYIIRYTEIWTYWLVCVCAHGISTYYLIRRGGVGPLYPSLVQPRCMQQLIHI